MSQEIEDLIRKLTPIRGSAWAEQRLQEYANGKFSPTMKKAIEQEVKGLANFYKLEDQIIPFPVVGRRNTRGDYRLGEIYYGKLPLDAAFALRDSDFTRHVLICGGSGTGKTTAALDLVKGICKAGKSFTMIDSKGSWDKLIWKDYARDVKFFQLGSEHAPLTLNPFQLLPGMDEDVMISEVMETFLSSQFLGVGSKEILRKAIANARKKGNLSIKGVSEEFENISVVGVRDREWKLSVGRALKSASTGILGRVLNSEENVPFEKLMNSQAVILLDLLADQKQIAMFTGFFLMKAYWYWKLKGSTDECRHRLFIEEFHRISKAESTIGESRIDYMFKTSREFGLGIVAIEQNPGEISSAVMGNMNTVISLGLGYGSDISAVATSMVLSQDERKYLGILPRGYALVRVKDRFPEKVLVKVDFEEMVKKEVPPEMIKKHNGEFVPIKPLPIKQLAGKDKLDPEYLEFMQFRDGSNLRHVYNRMAMSYRRGNSFRKFLEGQGYLYSQEIATKTGKETRLYLTAKGRKTIGVKERRRLGGPWHRSTVEQIAEHYRSMDFRVEIEYQDIDVFVDKGSEKVAIEVESLSGTKDYVNAVANIMKATYLADRVEVVVKDSAKAQKLQQYVHESPLKSYRGLTIKLVEEYKAAKI